MLLRESSLRQDLGGLLKGVRGNPLSLRRGYPYHDPLYTFIFLPNDFLPEVRINFRGVVDIKRDEVLWPVRRPHNQAKTQHPAPRFG